MTEDKSETAGENIKIADTDAKKLNAAEIFKSLRAPKRDSVAVKLSKDHTAVSLEQFKKRARDEKIRQDHFENLPAFVQKKASMISAHFLLPAGSKVADMGCGNGTITYALALLNPRVEFLGIDRDKNAVETAKRSYKLSNLAFRTEEIGINSFRDEGLDGIINSNILHQVYSENGYSLTALTQVLEEQIRKLKPGGTMLIRDYMMPPPDEFVLLEFPVTRKTGKTPLDMSDAELLIRFSETARPFDSAGCEGFFLEELAETLREDTRLFRLPRKWAVEFLHRKDERARWEKELGQEYTFFTYQDYRREFARLGMRMVYSAPYWNPWVIDNRFRGKFQLYTEDGTQLPPPATNYFVIAQKAGEKGSLLLEERRPLQDKPSYLDIVTVRDVKSGKLHEMVREPEAYCDIIPYRLTEDGRLLIFVHNGSPRPVINAVSRGNSNLDGKTWSGHLIEPITMDVEEFATDAAANKLAIIKYLEKQIGLTPRPHGEIEVGLPYFPSPNRIDEAIEPVYVEVRAPKKTSWPFLPPETENMPSYSSWGQICELEASDILHAAQIGVLPDPRLEIRVFELMMRLGLPFPKWMGEQMPAHGKKRTNIKAEDGVALLDNLEEKKFTDVNDAPEHLKAIRSVFVEEGHVQGTTRGLTSQNVEFIVTDDGIENIAVVLPLTHNWDDGLLVALDPQMLPAPQRAGGSGAMLTAPSFVLPKDVRTIEDAKAFVAQKFKLDPADVKQLGESYFTHTGVTPQRVYPFAIMADAEASLPPHWKYTSMRRLWILLYCFRCFSGDLLKGIARTHMLMDQGHGLAPDRRAELGKTRDFRLSIEKEEIYQAGINSPHRIPSRILGEKAYHGHVHLDHKKTVSLTQEMLNANIYTDVGGGVNAMREASVSLTATRNVKTLDNDINIVKTSLSKRRPLVATKRPDPGGKTGGAK